MGANEYQIKIAYEQYAKSTTEKNFAEFIKYLYPGISAADLERINAEL